MLFYEIEKFNYCDQHSRVMDADERNNLPLDILVENVTSRKISVNFK